MAGYVALVAAFVAACLLATQRRALGGAAAWLALAALGEGALLALTDAPPAVAYQHIRIAPLDAVRGVAIAILVAQLLALLTIGRSSLARVIALVRARVSPVALVVLLGALAATSAAPSREPLAYLAELAFASVVHLLAVATFAVAAASIPDAEGRALQARLSRWLGDADDEGPRTLDRWSVTIALLVVVMAASLAWFSYEGHPHVPDEVVYLYQARYLAEGQLTMPLPPVPEAFNVDLMHYETTRWYSPVNPGWPFVLAIGAWAGVPWLVNPILGGVAILLAYLVLGSMYDRRTTRLATLLLAASPWFLFLAMSYMTHPLTLVFALGAALGVARARQGGSVSAAFLGGLSTGGVSLVRPLEGLAVAMLVGLWSLPARGRWFRFAPSAALVVGSVLTGGVLVRFYNSLLTGDGSVFPIMAYIDKYYVPGSNALGFGANRGLGWPGLDPFPGHGALDVVVNAIFNTSQIDVEMLGWATGSVALIALVFALGRSRVRRADLWCVAAIVTVAGIHSVYWFSGGPDFGARYWNLVIVPCAALIARGLLELDAAPAPVVASSVRPDGWRVTTIALAASAIALLVFVPWRAVGKYRHYRGMRADVRSLAARHDFGSSLVLVRGRRHPDYASAAIYNPVDLRADAPVFAWDASPAIRAKVVEAYRGRPIWIVDGPSITGNGFRVAAGPIPASVLDTLSIRPDAAGDTHVWDPVNPPPPSLGDRP